MFDVCKRPCLRPNRLLSALYLFSKFAHFSKNHLLYSHIFVREPEFAITVDQEALYQNFSFHFLSFCLSDMIQFDKCKLHKFVEFWRGLIWQLLAAGKGMLEKNEIFFIQDLFYYSTALSKLIFCIWLHIADFMAVVAQVSSVGLLCVIQFWWLYTGTYFFCRWQGKKKLFRSRLFINLFMFIFDKTT